ncbi:MAG: response regulator transcription factor [Microthrixaceae bacterium]
MRVLIVEDERRMAETLARGLRRHGLAVDVALDGEAGFDKALVNDYDVVVLDRDLPGLHGDDVCVRLREHRRPCRILMLTASAQVEDLVGGFELGADDYLGKPFAFAELMARLRALGRRADPYGPRLLRCGDLELDPGRMLARRGDRAILFTPREFAVLEVLMEARGGLVSAEQLLERAWDEHADPFTTSVRVIVSRVRAKLGAPAVISTVVGSGYRLDAPP